MGTLTPAYGPTHYGRKAFLDLPWPEQKEADLRKVFDNSDADVNLTANCIQAGHRDDSASMVVYSNGVYCFGCKARWWPDQFLRTLGDLPLNFERGARKQAAPKFIPLAVPATYRQWLWGVGGSEGHYGDRRTWLLGRGLAYNTCWINYIGHTGEAYSIPIFDEAGSVKAIRYRRDDELSSEDRPKYWGTSGANAAMLYIPRGLPSKTSYGVILCEGELDALRLVQEGYPAVSLTNGCNALKAEHVPQLRVLARQLGTDRITICYDQDEPGRKGSDAAAALLEGQTGLVVQELWWALDAGKDVTEYLHNYPASLVVRLVDTWRSV